ncbi:MAG: serine/threonine-protein kinase [Planctomycetota bacterium]
MGVHRWLRVPDRAQETRARERVADIFDDDTWLSDFAEGEATPTETARLLAELVIDRGLATADEVTECRRHAKKPGSLGEMLVKYGAITKNQLRRLRADLEVERSGRRIPGYRLLEQVGKGSMAAVFRARQLSLDRIVAVKVLPQSKASDERMVESFYAESRAAAKLNHPNIVAAYDVGRAGQHHYYVMEFVEGATVHVELRAGDHGRMNEFVGLSIGVAMADALQHAHERELIHRDVKPKNIMITAGGVPKLADLGLARLVRDDERAAAEEGRTLGTPYYISPEQIRGDRHITPATDIYSLGATLFTMLTGRVPFPGTGLDEVLDKHLAAPVPFATEVEPGVSEGVAEVLQRMMAKDPAARYESAAELLVELRAWKTVAELRRNEQPNGAS